jgi:hypothetical protein
MFRKELSERDFPIISQDDRTIKILPVNLRYRLAAPPTRCNQHPVIGHSHNGRHVCFSGLQHFSHRGNLGTEAQSARQIDADAGVNVPLCRQNGRTDGTRREILSQFKRSAHGLCRFDQC